VPRNCTICNHPNLSQINKRLIKGIALRSIADRWEVSKTSLIRHKTKHLPASLVAARQAKEIASADNLLSNVCKLQRRAERILRKAESAGDHRTALAAIREVRSTIELLAKLLGELREGTNVNILITPEYQRMRTNVIEALEPYPDARLAVASALRKTQDARR
jgi:hypothetical protein